MSRRVATAAIAALLAAFATAWVLATEYQDPAPLGIFAPSIERPWPLTAGNARALRDRALRSAQVRISEGKPLLDLDVLEPPLTCRFVAELPTGTSPKFDCVLEGGEVVKVKYGRNPELAAEVAATRLMAALGYPADYMSIAPRLRCYGCPRDPFFAMRLLNRFGLFSQFPPNGREGFSDFEWAAVERKFDAASIESGERKGWAWWELASIDPTLGASQADVDALRLLAVFLAHWDNKEENQRLICLDAPGATDRACERPVAMIQDLGATFGPTKANLARWQSMNVWTDRAGCVVSMEQMPFHGSTFPTMSISEAGRIRLARQLLALPNEQVRELFRVARFPEHYSATDDQKDLQAWTAAFWHRVDQINLAGPCPEPSAPSSASSPAVSPSRR